MCTFYTSHKIARLATDVVNVTVGCWFYPGQLVLMLTFPFRVAGLEMQQCSACTRYVFYGTLVLNFFVSILPKSVQDVENLCRLNSIEVAVQTSLLVSKH